MSQIWIRISERPLAVVVTKRKIILVNFSEPGVSRCLKEWMVGIYVALGVVRVVSRPHD